MVRPKGIPIKEAKDLYCSGCAKQGHLEHTCDYYNRTHPPTTPVICEFKDVYNKESSPNKTGPIQEHQQAQRPQNMQQPVQQRQHVHEPRFTQETELNNFSFIQNFQKCKIRKIVMFSFLLCNPSQTSILCLICVLILHL